MKRLFAVVLAVACVASSTSAFARGGMGHFGGFHGGHGVNPAFLQNPAPQMPAFENRIPASLASPSLAPTINGPMSQPAFRGMTGIGQ
jgi:hypothetical protein